MERRYRAVVAEPGPDGQDRGAKVTAGALREAGTLDEREAASAG